MALKQETKRNFDFVLRNLLAGGKYTKSQLNCRVRNVQAITTTKSLKMLHSTIDHKRCWLSEESSSDSRESNVQFQKTPFSYFVVRMRFNHKHQWAHNDFHVHCRYALGCLMVRLRLPQLRRCNFTCISAFIGYESIHSWKKRRVKRNNFLYFFVLQMGCAIIYLLLSYYSRRRRRFLLSIHYGYLPLYLPCMCLP